MISKEERVREKKREKKRERKREIQTDTQTDRPAAKRIICLPHNCYTISQDSFVLHPSLYVNEDVLLY